jgi:hypothetical protein
MTAEKAKKLVCSKCGSDDLYKFNAGGLLQARCRRCTKVQSIGPHNYVQVEEHTVMGPAGPQVIAVPQPSIANAERVYEHDLDTGGFRDPRKQYTGEDDGY